MPPSRRVHRSVRIALELILALPFRAAKAERRRAASSAIRCTVQSSRFSVYCSLFDWGACFLVLFFVVIAALLLRPSPSLASSCLSCARAAATSCLLLSRVESAICRGLRRLAVSCAVPLCAVVVWFSRALIEAFLLLLSFFQMEDPLAAPPFAGGGMAAAASSALCGLPLFADCCNAAGPSASATASLANGISGEGFLLNAYGGVGAPTSPDAWAARACALHLFGCVRDAETLPELLLPGFEEAALSGLAATSASLPPLLTPSQGQASGAAATAAVTATATTGVFGAASSLPEEEVQQTHPSHASQEASAGAGASLSGGSPAFGCEESLRLTAEAAQLQAVCGAGSSAVFCGGVGSLLGGDGFSASAAGGLLTQSLTPALSAAVETQPSSCFLGQPVADPLLCAAAAHSLPETDAASAAASSGQSFERLTSQLLSSIAGMKELLLRDRWAHPPQR